MRWNRDQFEQRRTKEVIRALRELVQRLERGAIQVTDFQVWTNGATLNVKVQAEDPHV